MQLQAFFTVREVKTFNIIGLNQEVILSELEGGILKRPTCQTLISSLRIFSSWISSQESGLSASECNQHWTEWFPSSATATFPSSFSPPTYSSSYPCSSSFYCRAGSTCSRSSKSARQWNSLMYNGFRLLGMCLSLESLDNLSAACRRDTNTIASKKIMLSWKLWK